MSPLPILLLPPPILPNEGGEPVHAGNSAAELIFVFLLLLVFWGVFRITSKKRP